jgi:hypothetical protein
MQDVTREVIAGVPVYTGTPKGFVSSSSSSSSRLLVYLHGGAYIKGSCEQLWQVGMSLLASTAAAGVSPCASLSGCICMCTQQHKPMLVTIDKQAVSVCCIMFTGYVGAAQLSGIRVICLHCAGGRCCCMHRSLLCSCQG